MFSLPINSNTMFIFYGVIYLYKSFPVKAHSHQATPLRRGENGYAECLSQCPSKISKVPPVNGDGVVQCE